ncbi:hypothetical protein ACIP3U_33040 [[Kitasatospora] papulosa]|uniref:hypothetical protein n=1 Tax=[Kitasatospora] papulosa TaxID=1464011 RepID=UPI0037F43FB8
MQTPEAHHQQWQLTPTSSAPDAAQFYPIAHRGSGLLLDIETNAPVALQQQGADGDPRNRQWQLLPV